MTYKLNPGLCKTRSPIIIHLPDGKQRGYEYGESAVEDIFGKPYIVSTMTVVDNRTVIELIERSMSDTVGGGEEQVSTLSLFDGA